MLLTHIQLKTKLKLPSRALLILDAFSLLVRFTTMREWMVLHGVLLGYIFLGRANEETGH